MNRTALITGATSGIGKACAEILAKNQFNLIITGRRKNRLDFLLNELEKKHKISVTTFCFDVRDREETERQLSVLKGQTIDVLINNAGLAVGVSSIDQGSYLSLIHI